MSAMNINDQKFRELMQQDQPVLVDFWAPWCSYCRRISAAYDQIALEFGEEAAVVKVNIDEEPELAASQKIQVIPTLMLYRDGKALASIVAPGSKARIQQFLREHL